MKFESFWLLFSAIRRAVHRLREVFGRGAHPAGAD